MLYIVSRPGDAGYNAARRLFDPRFDVVHPAAIAKCRGPSDVQQSIEFRSACPASAIVMRRVL
jgi:hypothetical protein